MMNGSAVVMAPSRAAWLFPNVQGLCPNGWHVPSHYEWILLAQTVCAQSPAGSNCTTDFPYDETTQGYLGTTEGAKLKSTSTSWAQYNGMYCCDRACDDATTTMWNVQLQRFHSPSWWRRLRWCVRRCRHHWRLVVEHTARCKRARVEHGVEVGELHVWRVRRQLR